VQETIVNDQNMKWRLYETWTAGNVESSARGIRIGDAKRYSKVYDQSLHRPFENHLGHANRRSSLYDNTSALPTSRLLFQIRKLGLVNLSRVTVAPVMPSAPLAAVVLGNFSSSLHHLTLQ
jgi:hypothetical protein